MEISRANAEKNNAARVQLLHPDVSILFSKFIYDCEQIGIPVWIYSGLRSFDYQAQLRTQYLTGETSIEAAPSGRSYHNYGLAIDIYVWNEKLGKFNRGQSYEIYRKLQPIAAKYGLRWLGATKRNEMHHFDYNKVSVSKLLKAYNENKLDANGYVLLDEVENKEVSQTRKKLVDQWKTELGESYIDDEQVEEQLEQPRVLRKIAKVEKQNAVGIWQIIKMVSDQYSLSQNINDATFSHSQGSLMNYIQNVVQAPWLQFWGDTVGDQFYFFTRKEPFDYNGWTELPTMRTIYANEVLSDDLKWYDGDVFSWYQIIPRGSFLGQQNLIFAYITAVFFEEYAEIWGSKPNIQVSNYVNFTKIRGQSSMNKKAIEDLRYMVESNAYLPFTRQGTITVRGTTTIKRGYKIFYHPTGEEFYVDSISTRYQSGENDDNFITVLQVSRGMKIEYTAAPFKYNSIGYFNLIDFQNERTDNVETEEERSSNEYLSFYFDNDRSYLIDLNEDFSNGNDTVSQKMRRQIEAFPNLRSELNSENIKNLNKAVKIIRDNPKAEKYICTGYIDSDTGAGPTLLAKNRAVTVKGYIIDEYLRQYTNFTKEELEQRIDVKFDTSGKYYSPLDEQIDDDIEQNNTLDGQNSLGNENVRTLKTKALERFSLFEMLPYKEKVTKEIITESINWKVKDEVFQFFVNRKQFANN